MADNKGFTLMEILVAMAIMAILTAMAYPSFSTWRENAEYRDAARDIASQLRNARSTAISESRNVEAPVGLGAQTGSAVTLRSGEACDSTEALTVEFRPDGSVTSVPDQICVQAGSTTKFFVEITSQATGRVEINRP